MSEIIPPADNKVHSAAEHEDELKESLELQDHSESGELADDEKDRVEGHY